MPGHPDDRRGGRQARRDPPAPVASSPARHREEIEREGRDHEKRECSAEAQPQERRQKQQERRRVRERIILVRVYAERDLMPM
jgi:hypothetical protein